MLLVENIKYDDGGGHSGLFFKIKLQLIASKYCIVFRENDISFSSFPLKHRHRQRITNYCCSKYDAVFRSVSLSLIIN